MFFNGGTEEASSLNGHVYPHPALVFKVNGHSLFVRALADDSRPDVRTPLKTAPYWNTRQDNGLVCMGITRLPDSNSADSIVEWEQAFFRSFSRTPMAPCDSPASPAALQLCGTISLRDPAFSRSSSSPKRIRLCATLSKRNAKIDCPEAARH